MYITRPFDAVDYRMREVISTFALFMLLTLQHFNLISLTDHIKNTSVMLFVSLEFLTLCAFHFYSFYEIEEVFFRS